MLTHSSRSRQHHHSVPSPYEASNVALTFFAVGARYATLRESTDIPLDVTLAAFQQSPLDHSLGDAQIAIAGRHVLLEFKREESDLRSEIRKKPKRLALLNALAQQTTNMAAMRKRSLKGHIVAFRIDAGSGGVLYFGAYYTVLTELRANAQRPDQTALLPLLNFVDALLQPSAADIILQDTCGAAATGGGRLRAVGMSLTEFTEYVALMLEPGGNDATETEASSSVGGSSEDGYGGVLVSISTEGKLSCAFYDSDIDLARLRNRALEVLAQPAQQTHPPTPGATATGAPHKVDSGSQTTNRGQGPRQ